MVVGQAQQLHSLPVRRKSMQDSIFTYLHLFLQEVWPEEVLAPGGPRLHPGQLPLHLPTLHHQRRGPGHLLCSARRGLLLRVGEPAGE